MGAGLQIINDNGIVQIDQDFACFQFAQSYTVNVVAANSSGTNYAFESAGDPEDLYAVGDTGGQPVSFGGGSLIYYGNVARQIKIYRFTKASNLANTTFGLQIFKSDGSLAFSMSRKAMVISDFFIVPNGYYKTPVVFKSTVSNFAVIYRGQKIIRWAINTPGFPTAGMSLEAVSISGLDVKFGFIQSGGYPNMVPDSVCLNGGPFLLVDVTGL